VGDSRVGDSRDEVGGDTVAPRQGRPAPVTALLHVDPLVKGGWVSIIDPQKGANLHLQVGLPQHLHSVGRHANDLPGSQVTQGPESQVEKGTRLGGYGQGILLPAYHHRGAPQFVTGGNDPLFGEHQNGTGSLHQVKDILNARHQVASLTDQHGHQFGGVGAPLAGLGKMLPLL